MPSEPSLPDDRCTCRHIRFRHQWQGADGRCSHTGCACEKYERPTVVDVQLAECTQACAEGHTYSGSCLLRAYGPVEPGEPPLMPEEEELLCAREGGCTRTTEECEHACMEDVEELTRLHDVEAEQDCPCMAGYDGLECPCTTGCGCCPVTAAAPPHPERRPPYAVAYSVGGHLYEAYVPGDATVCAIDGVLIIEHSGSAVSGITQVLPVRQEK